MADLTAPLRAPPASVIPNAAADRSVLPANDKTQQRGRVRRFHADFELIEVQAIEMIK